MGLMMLGAIAGGFSGAIGYFLAGKFHGDEKGQQIYPLYALVFFSALVLAAKTIYLK